MGDIQAWPQMAIAVVVASCAPPLTPAGLRASLLSWEGHQPYAGLTGPGPSQGTQEAPTPCVCLAEDLGGSLRHIIPTPCRLLSHALLVGGYWISTFLPLMGYFGRIHSRCVLSGFGSQAARGSALSGDPTSTLTVRAEGVDTVAVLALAGSAASSNNTHFPNGSPGYAASCSSQEVDVPPKAAPSGLGRWPGTRLFHSTWLSSHSKDRVHPWLWGTSALHGGGVGH